MPKNLILGTPEPFHLINRIPIIECGEPLVDLRGRRDTRFLVLAPGCLPYVRVTILDMLIRAQAHLPWEYHIRVSTALRTIGHQERLYWTYYRKLQADHPEWPLSALRRTCNKYFAPPDVKAPPGHCTGGAVDVGLVDLQYKGVDVTSPHTEFWKGAPTFLEDLSAEADANRKILIHAMSSAGFSNCRDEWWHWSFGDSAWAVRVGAQVAPYGLIHPPENYTHVPRQQPRVLTESRRGILRPDRWRRIRANGD